MVHARTFLVVALAMGLPVCACSSATPAENDGGVPAPADGGAAATSVSVRVDTREAMLAEVQWTRFYAMSAQNAGADKPTAFDRLSRSEDGIASLVGTYAGQQSQATLASILHARAQLFTALVAPASAPGVDVEGALFDNATTIARFFHELGPAWSETTLKTELDAQLQATFDGMRAYEQRNEMAVVAAYDTGDQHTLALADAIASGLAQQYANQLSPPTSSAAEQDLQLKVRLSMDEHAFWIRMFVVERLVKRNGQPSLDRASNADVDFGNIFASHFGSQTGGQAQYSLHTDETDATAYEIALEMGDPTAVSGTSAVWDSDGNKFAQFLASPPIVLPIADVQPTLTANVENERAMVTARFTQQWDTDATSYSLVVVNLHGFADTIAKEIVLSTVR